MYEKTKSQVRHIGHLFLFLHFFANTAHSNFHDRHDKTAKQRRICKIGAGIEATPNKNDTPGFPLIDSPSIIKDIRGFKRLELTRNHNRISQTSLVLAQSWRANCDVQVLLYDSDPLHPDPEDVARATDYIVAYACKGVETLKEEKKQMIALVLQGHETFGDKSDVQRLARQLLNRTVGEKMISKQEAMVHIGQLDLVDCSESIDTVSISGYYKLNTGRPSTTFLKKYASRPHNLKHLTLHEYFHVLKNKAQDPSTVNASYVPHYVGANSHPQYPPTIPYARSVILLHKPWFKTFEPNQDFVSLFQELIDNPTCPLHVKLPYLRIKARVEDRKTHIEPTNTLDDPICPFLSDKIPNDLKDAIQLANTLPITNQQQDFDTYVFDYGKDHDWSRQYYPVSTRFLDQLTYVQELPNPCHILH